MQIVDAHLVVLLAIGLVLMAASLAGRLMSMRASKASSLAFAENWNARVHTWCWMVAAGGAALLLGHVAMVALLMAVSFLALREFAVSTTIPAGWHWLLALGFYVLLPLHYVLILTQNAWLVTCVVPACTLVTGAILWTRRPPGAGRRRSCMEVMLGFSVCIYGLSYVLAPLWMLRGVGTQDALTLVVCVVLLAQGSDVLQFLWGKALGRIRIAPRLSPGKTLEGLAGGTLSTAVLATALAPWMSLATPHAFAFGALIASAGFLGGLILSAVKRSRGIKDWGTLLPGHGGILDRVDSLWFSGPVSATLFALWR